MIKNNLLRKQYHLCIAFQQFLYHQGLVDKISVFIYDFLEVLHPDGDFFPLFGITHSLTLLSLHTASHFPRAASFAICYSILEFAERNK